MVEVERDPTRPIKRIYNQVVQRDQVEEEHIPEYNNVKSKLQRKRASLMPPTPGEIQDVEIVGEWERTWTDRQFLSHQDNDWGLLVFATNQNFRHLQQCENVYIDGTFKTCPQPYEQFVTIHGLYHGRPLPLIMSLMGDRTVGAYRQLLQHVKEEVREVTGHHWRPRRVISDFEVGLLTAIETELPRTRTSGCYFHFCQSLWRRIQTLGLARRYMRSRRLRKCLRKFMAIGYLPLALVRQNFQMLATSNSTLRQVARYPELQDFINYMERNYINGQFPPVLWNVFQRNNDTRTNNHVEGNMYPILC